VSLEKVLFLEIRMSNGGMGDLGAGPPSSRSE
jgi:hypothetical protein